jgi:hypothetical protein
MITPAQIRKKAQKLWESGRVLQSALQGKALFPWYISYRKPSAQQQLDDFTEVRQWVQTIQGSSKQANAGGYSVEYKTFNHRLLGTQQLPAKICFSSREDLLRYLGRVKEFQRLLSIAEHSCIKYPVMREWLIAYPRLFMKYQGRWSRLLKVCDYFILNPRPNCYLRELDIALLDSKFIEKHRSILMDLLDLILPVESIDQQASSLKQHGFERRYGLKYEQPLLRLRLLDPDLFPIQGLSDISLPVEQLNRWGVPCRRVFITENKINGLSFPDADESLVVFGLGYGVDSLCAIDWLKNLEIFYWGDIDTHGFSILSRLRHHFPEARSLMMDKHTLERHQALCIPEPENARCKNMLNNLRAEEQALYQQLQQSHQRLEQERIPISFVKQRIRVI